MGNIRYITRVVMHGSFVLHGEEETSVLLFFESFGSFAMCMYVCIYVYIGGVVEVFSHTRNIIIIIRGRESCG